MISGAPTFLTLSILWLKYIVAGRAPILPLDRHLFPALCKSTRPTFLFPMKQYIRR